MRREVLTNVNIKNYVLVTPGGSVRLVVLLYRKKQGFTTSVNLEVYVPRSIFSVAGFLSLHKIKEHPVFINTDARIVECSIVTRSRVFFSASPLNSSLTRFKVRDL